MSHFWYMADINSKVSRRKVLGEKITSDNLMKIRFMHYIAFLGVNLFYNLLRNSLTPPEILAP